MLALAATPYRIGSHDRDGLVPGLRSYLRQQANPQWNDQKPTPYRVLSCGRLLHDATEVVVQLHLPNN